MPARDRVCLAPIGEDRMSRRIFVNLPVKDLKKSMAFFCGLGFAFDEQFTNDDAGFMVVNDQAAVMLVTEPFFETFSDRSIADTTTHYEVSNAISVDSREEVDRLAEIALRTGGTPSKAATDDGFMYSRGFRDPDGHLWDLMWMAQNA
jgi:uncharacterized protein